MNRLALGTAQFGLPYGIANQTGQISPADAKAMLRLAATAGVDTLDTAIAYGGSEARLGEAGVAGFKVVSKLPACPQSLPNPGRWVQEETAGSLARLGVGSLYGLLLHRPMQLLEPGGAALYRGLLDLKEAGLTAKIGVSVYAPDELDALCPHYRFDLVQAPLNLVDRRLETSGWLRRLKDMGVETHTRSVFLQGLLLLPSAAVPARFAPWAALWDRWRGWLEANRADPLPACLAYPLSLPEVDRVVVGADNPGQLGQIVQAAAGAEAAGLPDLRCDDEDLINPSRWPKP